MKLLKPNSKMK